jgi:hypothetical protein
VHRITVARAGDVAATPLRLMVLLGGYLIAAISVCDLVGLQLRQRGGRRVAERRAWQCRDGLDRGSITAGEQQDEDHGKPGVSIGIRAERVSQLVATAGVATSQRL